MSSKATTTDTTFCWGEQVCGAQGWSFDEVFRHQFRIARSPIIASQRWKKRQLGSFWIEHCPHLPATEILNRRGQLVGWCLGVAIDASGGAIGCEGGAPLTVTATFDAIERRHSQLAGRFALIVKIADQVRYYPDATSGLTAVANDSLGVIASTVALAINDELQPSGGRTVLEIQRKPTLYLMDETPDARVRQLRANHFVDLDSFGSHRFWPKDDTRFEPHEASEQSVVEITKRLQVVMASLVRNFRCTLPLTGGRDSRVLAAALPREAVDHLGALYVHEINWSTGFDVESAKQAAAHLDIPITVKRVLGGGCDDALADLNVTRTRAQIGLATGYAHPHLHQAVIKAMHVEPDNQLLLRGGAVEVAQANKYPGPLRIPDEITPDFAFQRLAGHGLDDLNQLFGAETIDRYWRKYRTWFDELPAGARQRAVDLGHMELWLSSGMGAVFYAPRKHFYVNPFSDQMLLHKTMRFDPVARKNGSLLKSILDELSPGLAQVTYAKKLIKQARNA